MRKEYPYLQDSYYENINNAKERRNFLSTIDDFINKKQYVKITLLNWEEEPLKEIQGELISGSISKDGSSSVRRTCQFTTSVNRQEYTVENSQMDFAINKKIFIEIGIKNYSNQFPEYPILWFPQGVFFIGGISISSSTSSAVNLSLTLKDKMAGLNGDVGGKFPATVIVDEVDTQSPSGKYVTEKILVYNIIQELVNHFGGENLNNIVIEDIPLRIKRVMKWTGNMPMWLIPAEGTSAQAGNLWYQVEVDEPALKPNGTVQIINGSDAGYIYDSFVYTQPLVAAPGDTVCSVLDKIKAYMGNYEYFYDEFGVFHFREIKNYLNTTQGKTVLEDMNKNDYLVEITSGKSVYAFSDNNNLTSINSNPQYENIKNDYVVQGLRKMTGTDISYPIRYHLVIDKKPPVGNTYYDLLLFKEKSTNLIKAVFPFSVNTEEDLPQPGNFNLVYRVGDKSFFYWEDNVYKAIEVVEYFPPETSSTIGYTTKDWRTELYLQGLLTKNKGTDAGIYYNNLKMDISEGLIDSSWMGDLYRQNQKNRIDTDFYFEELDAFWPQIYNLHTQKFYGEEEDKTLYASSLTSGNFYLDFIEPSSSGLGEFSISNIGRRGNIISNDDINCLFEPSIPDIVFLNIDDENFIEKRQECQLKGQPFTQVRGEVYWAFATGGYNNGAFDQIKYDLYLHTNYQRTLSIGALPVFYLEPNTRVTINDKSTNTYGDYIVQNISLSLGAGSTMTASCSEAIERF